MPLYKYHCPECGEEITKIEQIGTKTIPCECGEEMEREKVNSFSSRYKGSGFYETDYGNDK